jgi:hypothetical protein
MRDEPHGPQSLTPAAGREPDRASGRMARPPRSATRVSDHFGRRP